MSGQLAAIRKTGFGGESEICSIKITRAQEFAIANSIKGRRGLWAECDVLPKGIKHPSWQTTSVDCLSGMCRAGVSQVRERMRQMRRQGTSDDGWLHGAVPDCRTVLQGDIERGAPRRMSKKFDSQRFAARPGTGNVDSLATAHPDRSPTNREES